MGNHNPVWMAIMRSKNIVKRLYSRVMEVSARSAGFEQQLATVATQFLSIARSFGIRPIQLADPLAIARIHMKLACSPRPRGRNDVHFRGRAQGPAALKVASRLMRLQDDVATRILVPACAVLPWNSAPERVLHRVVAFPHQRHGTSQHLRPLEKLARRRGFKLYCVSILPK